MQKQPKGHKFTPLNVPKQQVVISIAYSSAWFHISLYQSTRPASHLPLFHQNNFPMF